MLVSIIVKAIAKHNGLMLSATKPINIPQWSICSDGWTDGKIHYIGNIKCPRFLFWHYRNYHTEFVVKCCDFGGVKRVIEHVHPHAGDIIIMPDGDRWLVTEGGACLIVSS